MKQLIIGARPYLEALYFLSGIVVAIAALFALRQIRLLKLDMLARSDRAAKEKAIDAAFEYVKSNEIYAYATENLDPSIADFYRGPVGDFSPESIPSEFRDMAKLRDDCGMFDQSLDLLDGIAAMFVSGIADEKVAFPVFGGAFCADVANHYDIIVAANAKYTYGVFKNIIELYQVWSPRLTKADLAKARQNLDKQIELIGSREIPPLSPLKKSR